MTRYRVWEKRARVLIEAQRWLSSEIESESDPEEKLRLVNLRQEAIFVLGEVYVVLCLRRSMRG